MVKELKTGDLVLCKVGSFPPWPAVVFPQRLLRNDVYRKRRPNCVAVCFFNDPTYYWEQPHKLRPFEAKTVENFVQQEAASTSQEDLVEAYRQAQGFSSLNDFIVDRLKEEDRFGELKEELNRETILPGEDPFMSKAEAKKRKSIPTNTKGKGKRSIKPENGEKEEDRNTNDTQSSVAKHKDDTDENRTGGNKRRKKSKLDHSRKVEISLLIRRRLQQNLVQRDSPPSKQEILDSHKLLNKISENLVCDPPFFDIDALRESKLHKLLKVIVNDPELDEFHYICKDILVHWIDIIAQLKAEKLTNDQKQQQQQPQQQPQDHAPTETTII
ncbi:hypothetical protein ZYGR_0AK00450 [Zygosaccharomyces rouxii]|uniref:PWWP domain-containing protein n=1 Tax=Zygosaccharomyces rouxii TaxID=4956 RepID=A0A1Q3ADG4_ZYGRO|nr:hypothetical protein ZYGR_0AK00450 [Zygosaccharomyces rouxii]